MIQDSQRRGVAGRDAKAYMRIWTADARLVNARREQPSGHDYVLERSVFEPATKVRSQGAADMKIEMSYRDEQVTLAGERATVVWKVQASWRTQQGDVGDEVTSERYELEKTVDGWRVKENRFWPLSLTFRGRTTIYDDAEWERLDAAVDGAKVKGDELDLAIALYQAFRMEEGFELTGKLTKKVPGRGEYWLWRARFADRLRNVDETLRAYEQLKTIDPGAELPGWVLAHQQGKR